MYPGGERGLGALRPLWAPVHKTRSAMGLNFILVFTKMSASPIVCTPFMRPSMASNDAFSNPIDRSLNYGRHHISGFLHYANHSGMKVVVDIGAGWGDDLLLARAARPDVTLHAIEIHPEYQQALQKKGVIVHPLNIERDPLPFMDESVDVVIANQILEHVKEVFWILHEATRVIRKGGFLLIGVPNLASLHNRLLLLLGQQPTCIQNLSAHVRGYTRQDLMKLLRICFPGGYTLRQFGGSNFYPFPRFLARPLAAAFPGMAWSVFFLLEKQQSYRGEFLTYPLTSQLETNFYLGPGQQHGLS